MLKSTHRAVALPPLPPGWTEHRAPTGHSYYYHAETQKSTYTRPVAPTPPVGPSAPEPLNPNQSFLQYQSVGNAVPSTAQSSFSPPDPAFRGGFQHQRGGRGGHARDRPKPQPTDKPKSRQAIAGCEPWVLVHTKYGRRFVYNTEKDQSFWRIPDKLKDGILALDQQRIKEKAEALIKEKADDQAPGAVSSGEPQYEAVKIGDVAEESEYEEVEVTDDENEDPEEQPSKRQRIGEGQEDDPVEFNEDDIAYQLAAMGQDYGLDPSEYNDGNMDWEENDEALTAEDSSALFKDLLNDFGINPYSPWEKLIDEGKLVDDTRYTALTTMKARRDVWEEWSREKIKDLKEIRAKEEKKDPRIPYLYFLHKYATPKLYWPEFKRKYRKEPAMRDTVMTDKEREKLYREHINRLKLPQSTLKSDLSTLLKAQTSSALNNSTPPTHLPPSILTDIRYISLDAQTRDVLIETYITTLPPAPEIVEEGENEEVVRQRQDRERRQQALEEREKRVKEVKRRQERDLNAGKGILREEEEGVERAMRIGKKGLRDQLMVDG